VSIISLRIKGYLKGDSMRARWTLKPGRYNLIRCIGGVILVCLFGTQAIWADDALTVKRDSERIVYTIGASDEKNNALDAQSDKERNVYSIGSSKEKRDEEALKQERSWDMLMNVGIWQDSPRNDRPGQNRPPKNQPAQDQPPKGPASQPVSGK
jgi:hypothetical protein